MAAEHAQLVAEMAYVERLQLCERLRHAKKRRMQQLKAYQQREKQLTKGTANVFGKRSNKRGSRDSANCEEEIRPTSSKYVKFADSVLLLDAVARNDSEEVKNLLDDGMNANVCGSYGFTALHQCCVSDTSSMVNKLLDAGADVNARDFEQWTPLHAAAACGRVSLCKALTDRGANLLAVNADGNMPYDLCEDTKTLDFIETEMARQGVTQDIIDEVRLKTESVMLRDVKQLLKDGGSLNCRGDNGETLMHIAASNNFTEVMQFLMDNGVSCTETDNDTWQAIHCAAYWSQIMAVELLLLSGVDPEVKTGDGRTILDLCEDVDIRRRIIEIVDELANNRRHLKASDKSSKSTSSTSVNRRANTSRSAWQRRSSVHEKKDAISSREAREEAERLHEAILKAAKEEEDERTLSHSSDPAENRDSIKTPSVESGPQSPASDFIRPADDDDVENEAGALSTAEVIPLMSSTGQHTKRFSSNSDAQLSTTTSNRTATPILKGGSRPCDGKVPATGFGLTDGRSKSNASNIDSHHKLGGGNAGEASSRKNGHLEMFKKSNGGTQASGKGTSPGVDSRFRKSCCIIV